MKRSISIVLAAVLVLTMSMTLFGCGDNETAELPVNYGEIGESLVAEKVGNVNRGDFMTARGGLYYQEDDGKYGVMSLEGRYDTGAVYAYCQPRGQYFAVSVTAPTSYADIKGLNSMGLINGKGKQIVPMKYASFTVLNERYVQVFEVTERIYSKDDALVYYSDNTFSFSASDSDVLFAGKWYVYDIVAGGLVNGVSGTESTTVIAKGNMLTYTDAAGTRHSVNEKGVALPEGATLFDDGSYAVEGKIGEVYDTTGTKLFGYDLTGFIPSSVSDGYYIARKYVDGATKYAVMDNKGTVVSAEFDDYISIYKELIHCDSKVYNFAGKNIIAGEYGSMEYDKMFESCWILHQNDDYVIIKADGTILYKGTHNKNGLIVYPGEFVMGQKKDSDYYFFNHATKEYSIKGNTFASWIVKTANVNSLYNVTDTMTGKNLLEGYSSYSYSETDSTALYVYAKYNGGADVYLIVSEKELEELLQKKEKLLDDLIAAFEKEGITVSINKESGEIALDSSVLFGGDSAELTDAGKTFLNKFIKVYTTIAFSGEYDGFISKTMVEGHTAPIEGSTYASGLPLSEERASVVKNYCLSAETGVDVSKIADALEAVGYSNSKPIYNTDGSYNLAACRRVSFRFMMAVEF